VPVPGAHDRALPGARLGPLLDRIDLHLEVPALSLRELRAAPGEPSAVDAARIAAARAQQQARFGAGSAAPVNAAMSSKAIARHGLDKAGCSLLDAAFEKLRLSARALDRILKVARTLADLAGQEAIRPADLAEAIQYRALDRRLTP
jgi:magnesium chelatase family protein